MNEKRERHEMTLAAKYPSGAEEWYCPQCDRRFLMNISPYRKIVLEAGDEQVIHQGGKQGILLQTQITKEPKGNLSEDLIDALEDALKDVDFEDWPDNSEDNGPN